MSPAAAPTASIRPWGPGRSGTNAAMRSSNRSVPRAWVQSATFGFQPPDTSSRSASTASCSPPARVMVTDVSRPASSPLVPTTRSPARASTVATSSTPAAASVAAAPSVVPLFVKMTARSPGRTPYRAMYVSAAPASMIPGRSSSAKTMGRSVAPVAMTIRPARMCQSRPSVVGVGRRSTAVTYPWS